MTDGPPIIINEDAAIDSAFFGSHAGRTCYARAHRSGWVLVVRQVAAQRETPTMLRVWGLPERVPMTMGAAWRCGSVAPIRADTELQGCVMFRIALPDAAAQRGSGPTPASLACASPGQLHRGSGFCENENILFLTARCHQALIGLGRSLRAAEALYRCIKALSRRSSLLSSHHLHRQPRRADQSNQPQARQRGSDRWWK